MAQTREQGFDTLWDMRDNLRAIMEHDCVMASQPAHAYGTVYEYLRITGMQTTIAIAERCKSIALVFRLRVYILRNWEAVRRGYRLPPNGRRCGTYMDMKPLRATHNKYFHPKLLWEILWHWMCIMAPREGFPNYLQWVSWVWFFICSNIWDNVGCDFTCQIT